MPMTDPAARVAAPALRRRGPASTEDGRHSRDRVLKAALDLIIEAGIDQVRLAEIARRAGMSSGQVMYYFTSKEHILLETLAFQEYQDTVRRQAALAKVTGAWRQLKRFIELYLPGTPPDPSWILWMEAWARAPHNKEVSRFLEELLNPWQDDLAAWWPAVSPREPSLPRTRPVTSPAASSPCSTALRSSACSTCRARPASTSQNLPCTRPAWNWVLGRRVHTRPANKPDPGPRTHQ